MIAEARCAGAMTTTCYAHDSGCLKMHLKQVLPKSLTLIVFMYIEVQNTDWLYLRKRARLCTDEKFLFASLDASQNSQSAGQKDLSPDSGL